MLPHEARISYPQWSPDGQKFLFTNTTDDKVELWICDAQTAHTRRLEGLDLNAAFGLPATWLGSSSLIIHQIPQHRGKVPVSPATASEPFAQESRSKHAAPGVHKHLIRNPHDEDLFDHYATAQLALVDLRRNRVRLLGQPGIFPVVDPSPNGKLFLIAQIQRPYSRSHPYSAFPREIEIWNREGAMVHVVTSRPSADDVPSGGVPAGPREFSWHPLKPATLTWVEALDEGDPARTVSHRDRVVMLSAPFKTTPRELARTTHRFSNLRWTERGTHMLVSDYDQDQHWRRTVLLQAGKSRTRERTLWSYDARDRAKRPGSPLPVALPNGRYAVGQCADSIFLAGEGASPTGPRPFLDRIDLKSLKTVRLFQSEAASYEEVVALVGGDNTHFITRSESATDPPNYILREIPKERLRRAALGRRTQYKQGQLVNLLAITRFVKPMSGQHSIRKRLVTYKRSDGLPLSGVLYLPPNHREGKRFPLVMWSYPHEFSDRDTASQINVSADRFTTIRGASPLFLLFAGYAILEAAMPIVGSGGSGAVNGFHIEQLTMNARAAIEKVVQLGLIDPERVGVGGHSYGAAMAANLLAHGDLFRAGVALSGAYNRTLTPFGFQNERRTLWEDESLYMRMSPYMRAHKIKAPLLLVHGEMDHNPGTPALQSQRMYDAIAGNGGTARLILLPHEGHTYVARESVEHVLAEMVLWFDRFVKD
jgi:dipeptidyl aminopeptidase/acylaminoacyl peptidase